MTCPVCKGSGSFYAMVKRTNRWWTCPACNGVGTLVCYAPYRVVVPAFGQGSKFKFMPPPTLSLADFAPNERTVAHAMVRLGDFKSVTQARKNGWDGPLVVGEIKTPKGKVKAIIVE